MTAFAATEALILGRHIEVDFLVRRLSKRFRLALACVTDLICIVFLAVVVWRCTLYGHDMQMTGEVSPSQKIPLAPFVKGGDLKEKRGCGVSPRVQMGNPPCSLC